MWSAESKQKIFATTRGGISDGSFCVNWPPHPPPTETIKQRFLTRMALPLAGLEVAAAGATGGARGVGGWRAGRQVLPAAGIRGAHDGRTRHDPWRWEVFEFVSSWDAGLRAMPRCLVDGCSSSRFEQFVPRFRTRFREQIVRFGTAFDGTRFNAIRTSSDKRSTKPFQSGGDERFLTSGETTGPRSSTTRQPLPAHG